MLKRCDHTELLGLIQAFQPTVLLLDDLDLSEERNNERLLALLEALRDPDCIVFATMMTPPKHHEKAPKPGSWHFPGMRPGRVDNMFTLYLPDADDREEILLDYASVLGLRLSKKLLRKLVKKTKGLSGAYLMRVVSELSAHGTKNWKDEVNMVLYTAPFPEEEGEGGEKKDGAEEGEGNGPTPAST